MSLDILRSIRHAEEEAEQKRKKSQAEANEILTEAKKEAYLIIEKELQDAEKEANEIIKKAEDSALGDIQKIQNECKEECAKMKVDAAKRLDAAVELIVRKVVTIHGNN